MKKFNKAWSILIWALLAFAIATPILLAAYSPLLAWRDPIYIVASFAGILGLVILLLQPLLAGGYLPDLSIRQMRNLHRYCGLALVIAVTIHVGGLWLTSPPDVIDALLFASPTPFSAWGVVAMWAIFGSAAMAIFRRQIRIKPKNWKLGHSALAVIIVIGTIVHAYLIEGTMETVSKIAISALVLVTTLKVVFRLWGKR